MNSSPTPRALRPVVAAADGIVDQVMAFGWLISFVVLVSVGVSTLVLWVGIFALAAAVLLTRWLVDVERRRTASVFGLQLPDAPRPASAARGWRRPLALAWAELRSPFFWRGMLHLVLTGVSGVLVASVLVGLIGTGVAQALSPLLPAGGNIPTGWSGVLHRWPAFVAVPLGVVYVAMGWGLLAAVYAGHRALSSALLGVSDGELLRHQLRQASEQRDGAVRTVEVDRRRIERDLHDGVQPQLVNVGMLLSLAQSKLDSDPATARALLAEAHMGAKTAIHDLRQLGRGIHPSVLTDSGLDAALSALVAQFALPVSLDVNLPRRCPPAAESAAYFTVAEALTNAAKHAGASACAVRLRLSDADGAGSLVAEIADDGRGGAAILPHGGLAGLHDRLVAIGGRLDLSSGPSGTTVTASIPLRQAQDVSCA